MGSPVNTFEIEAPDKSSGFEVEPVQKKTTPVAPKAEPSYAGEAIRGLGRAAVNVGSMAKGLLTPHETFGATREQEVKMGPTGRLLYNIPADILQSMTESEAARQAAKRSGEGKAGQALAYGEKSLAGPIVKKAEEAGPGYAKFKPQTLGAVTEGVGTVAIPAAVAKAIGGTYGAKYRGGQMIERQVTQHAEAPVEPAAVEKVFSEIQDLADHAQDAPAIVRKVMDKWNEIKEGKATPAPGGGEIQGETPKGITFGDLVKLRRALDTKLWEEGEKKSTSQTRLAKKLRNVMDVEEYKTLHRAGTPSDVAEYAQGKKLYRRGVRLESSGRVVGGAVGGAAGLFGGAEAVRSTGAPYGGWIGGSLGAPIGGYIGREVGGRAATAYVEAGRPSEGPSPARQAAAEIRSERASSVKAAREFGKAGSMSNLGLENILRRSNIPEAEQAKIRQIIQQNEQMRRTRDLPKDPDAPTSEIMARGKAAYEQKYGKPKAKAEAKSSSWTEAPRHNDAIAQAKKELGPAADVRSVLKRADEIEREGRK